ncbi:MAG: hypothetical protein PSU94_02940 [Lacunisphaera sp.]|nr:hypothetical protein [Lacunisphaera sp.]
MPPIPSSSSPGRAALSAWGKRFLLLLGAPLVFFGLLEGGLRLVGVGRPMDFFIPDEMPGYYCANPAFTALFMPAQFGIRPLNFRLRQHKEAGGLRVFVLGESAAQGTPEPAFGFAAQLQAQLAAHYPGRKVEVCNLGITAINSHVVYEVARQLPAFEPDLFVVYMGNNEVIGPYGPGSAYLATTPPLWAIRASVWVRHLRTGQVLMDLMKRFGRSPAKAMEWRGMETFAQSTVRGNDPRLEAVYGNFENNLRDIIGVAKAAGARTVVATLVANLRDSSPFVSLHRENLTASERANWQTAFDAGMRAWQLDQADAARERFTVAVQIDQEHADTHFLLGRLAEQRGDSAAARRHYVDALQWDALRFRPVPRVNEIIRRVAREPGAGVQLVDAALELGADPASPGVPAGRELLFEHVHFNWEGNARLARMLAEACAGRLGGPGAAAGGWLDAAQCADALGLTDYGRLTMLKTITQLTGKPPFTSQLTYPEAQTQFKAEFMRLNRAAGTAAGLQAAADKVETALQGNPLNPAIAVQLENIVFDQRNFDRALALVEQAMALQPRSAVLLTQKANLLQIFKRYNEAEELAAKSTRDDPYYYPAWQVRVDIWSKTGQFALGREELESRLAQMPGNNYLRSAYATLLLRAGETGAAESQWRSVLETDPTNTSALEQLITLYQRAGRAEDGLALMAEASRAQPRNYTNNSRLAQIYATKGDTPQMVRYLLALTESGPADASLYLELAQRLVDLGRVPEAEVYAYQGRKAALAEGNATLIRAAEDLLARLRR